MIHCLGPGPVTITRCMRSGCSHRFSPFGLVSISFLDHFISFGFSPKCIVSFHFQSILITTLVQLVNSNRKVATLVLYTNGHLQHYSSLPNIVCNVCHVSPLYQLSFATLVFLPIIVCNVSLFINVFIYVFTNSYSYQTYYFIVLDSIQTIFLENIAPNNFE